MLNHLTGFGAGFFAQQPQPSFWMPPRLSTAAAEVDSIFNFIFYISFFFFLLIVGLMVFFLIRYRRREGEEAQPSPSHNMALELTWTIIPLVLVGVIFYVGFKGFMDLNTPPANAYEIQVTGQRWNWMFTYPNGVVDKDLHVPVDVPVKLTMTSVDVIHSLYIPAFRIKRDLVPGRYTKAWFRATYEGDYQIFCAEYCGKSHSDMLARVVVTQPGEFDRWLEKAANFLDTMPPVEAGAKLYRERGCAQCHTVDGRGSTGPTLKGLFSHTVLMRDGSTVVVDENYLRESMIDPQAKVVKGFDPVMPTFKGRLKDREIGVIIEYIKTLEDKGK